MTIREIAAAAGLGLGLLAAGCQPTGVPLKPEDQTPVAGKPTDPNARDPFAQAVNFGCDGGAKVDIAFDYGAGRGALVRIDGGAPATLPVDESATSGMVFKDAVTKVSFEGDGLQLTSGGTTRACKFVARSLPPPAVAGVVRDIRAGDAGALVEMKVGEKISVSLSGVPTAGYVWSADAPPPFVKVSDGPGGATSSAQSLPGFAGGNHWEVLVIEAVAPGEGEIALVQKRPWEDKTDPSDERFKFKLKVK